MHFERQFQAIHLVRLNGRNKWLSAMMLDSLVPGALSGKFMVVSQLLSAEFALS
jgi:hypothetical protein